MSLVCRICLDVVAKDSQCPYYSLSDETDPCVKMIKWKLKKCLPEFTLDIIKDSVICMYCVDKLYVVYSFHSKFMETEEKLYEYMVEVNVDCNNQIDINSILKWLSKYEARKKLTCIEHQKIPIFETVIPNNSYDYYVKRVEKEALDQTSATTNCAKSNLIPLTVNVKSELVDESASSPIIHNAAFEKMSVEIDWNDKKSPVPDMYISSDQYIHTVTEPLKFDLEEESVDLNSDDDIKDVLVQTEDPKQSSSMIVSGLSCYYEDFLEFEEQFAGYTIDDFYSNQLIALPECSVVLDRLSDGEIKRWARRETSKEMQEQKIGYYRCYRCNYYTPLKKQFMEHGISSVHIQRMINSSRKTFKKIRTCHFCSFRTKFKNNLLAHMRTHEKSPMKCNVCQFTSNIKKQFKEHLELHMLMYKCAECSYAAKFMPQLRDHYIHFHFHKAPFRCGKCKLLFTTRLKLISHMLTYAKCKGGIYQDHNYVIL